jgi:hypothetical protein
MSIPPMLAVSIALGLLSATVESAAAQRGLPLGTGGPVLRLEIAKPIFDLGVFRDAHLASSTLDASLVLPLEGSVSLFAQLGMGIGEITGVGWGATISNPRIGAAVGGARGPRASVHTDLPFLPEMGSSFGTGVGRFTRFEEWSRYGPDTWGFGASASAETELGPGALVGARIDGALLLPMVDGVDRDAYGVVAVFGDAPAGSARLWLELSGLVLFTRPDLDIGQRTTVAGTIALSLPLARFAPEAYVRIPVDENLSGIVSFVIGVRAHIGSTRRGQ